MTLEEERDFLLRSLDDLEREHQAGDIDEVDYVALRDDYTARAAEAIRGLAEGRSAVATAVPPRSSARRLLTVVAVVGVAVLAGVLVSQSAGRRGSGGLTGLDVSAASSRVDDCQALEADADPAGALDCYTEILESLPGNVPALTFRGWLRVREFELSDGLADLDAAVQLAPEAAAPRVFRASARLRSGDAPGAVADLAAFYGTDPSGQERALADQFAPGVVDAALDACIEGDVAGSMAPVDVVQCYHHALDVDSGNATASAYLGWLLARTGVDDEQALSLLDASLEADPDLPPAYVFRAALRAHLGDTAGARADLDRFDTFDAPADQQAAASQVRASVDAGEDPLE